MPQPATPDEIDITLTARTIWGEARGEPSAGRQAVAAVIGNRAKLAAAWVARHGAPHPLFGNGHLASACQANHNGVWQFTCWSPHDPNRAKLLAVTKADLVFAACLTLARSLAEGQLTDSTDGATHYLDQRATLALYGHLPSWVAEMTQTASIGAHTFFRS